ncbi:hypothetical protein EKK58_11160, partial [Candidatus Dependentiae bacterium]
MIWILGGGGGLTPSQATALNSFIALATTPTGYHLAKDSNGLFVNTPDTGGSAAIAIGSTITSGTPGSILFVNSSGELAQDNSNLFWDDTNNRLGIGNSSPSYKLDVASSSSGTTINTLRLANNGTGANTQVKMSFNAASTEYANITAGYGAAAPQMAFDLPNVTLGRYIWSINGAEKMRIDTTGNVGIGSAPNSSWDAARKVLQISTTGALVSSANNTIYSDNWYFDGSVNKYLTTAAATLYQQTGGVHKWFTAPSGTAGTTATVTSRMELSNTGALTVASVTAITSNTDLSLGGNGTGAVKHTTSTYQDIVSATDGTTVTF